VMKRRSLVLAAAVLLSALTVSPARAAKGRWIPYGPPGGSLLSFAAHPSGRLFTVARQSGIYASTDGGRSWFWSGVGLGTERIRALAVDPEGGDLYAVGEVRAFRSTDQGRTWTLRAQGLFAPPVVWWVEDLLVVVPGADTAAPDTLLLARGTSLFRSPDGGATWQRADLHPPGNIATLLVDPRNDRSVFAGTLEDSDSVDEPVPGGLFHSADGGQTWSEVNQPALPFPDAPPPFSYGVTDLAALPTSPTTLFALAGLVLYRSTDDGESWQTVAPAPPPGGDYTYSVVVPGAPGVVLSLQQIAGDDDFAHLGLYSSRDLGTTWTRVDDGTIPTGTQLAVAADGELYGFGADGFSHGENGGAHWRHFRIGSQFCGRESTFPSGGLLRWSRDGSRLYSLVGFRLFQSHDGGGSWTARSQSFSESCAKLTDVQIDPSRSDALFITTDAGISRSDDSGASWTATGPPGRPEDVPAFNTLAITQGDLLGGGCGVARSSDGGRTWRQTLSCGLSDANGAAFTRFVTRLRIDPKRPRVVYAEVTEESERNPQTIHRTLYRSADGGLTWRRLAARAGVVAVDPRTPQTLYLVKNGRLLQSLDDGRTWRGLGALPAGSTYDLLVDRADSRTLYAAGTFGVARSADGGVTWALFNNGLRGLSVVLNLFRDPRRPVLYAGAEGLFQIEVP
jgi:photosystem II stability/assembly factor-like uncharacterized protein